MPAKPFTESLFVVVFYGEGAGSTLVRGWENVQDFIDSELHNEDYPEASVKSPCCEIHDPDCWTMGLEINDSDQRLKFSKSEFAYCVGLEIIRVLENDCAKSGLTVRQDDCPITKTIRAGFYSSDNHPTEDDVQNLVIAIREDIATGRWSEIDTFFHGAIS